MDKDMELKLDMLATLQKTYALLYKSGCVCGIDAGAVQLCEEAYRDAFPEAVEEQPYTEHFNLMATDYNGVRFIALTDKEHENVQMS